MLDKFVTELLVGAAAAPLVLAALLVPAALFVEVVTFADPVLGLVAGVLEG